MSEPDLTLEASSADALPPSLDAELDSLHSQETLILELQSGKIYRYKTLATDMRLLWQHLRRSDTGTAAEATLSDQSYITATAKRLSEDEEILNEREQLRADVRREEELHLATMTEVEALRRQLDEEKKLHEETRLMRDQQTSKQNEKEKELRAVTSEGLWLRERLSEEKRLHVETGRARDQLSEQNNKQKELCEELQTENKALHEEIFNGREGREAMESEIEELRAELLKKREQLREEIMVEMKLEEAEQERSRRALLEQQGREMRSFEKTIARD